MLKQKKIEIKKLIMFIFIICVMLSGIVFFLYKNYTLTSSQRETATNIIVETELETDNESNIKKPAGLEVKSKNILNNQKIIDLGILFDPKFRELRENYSPTINFEVGKKNPFAP